MRRHTGICTDDQDGFDRPGRRSRPRTKDRPDYSTLPLGRIVSLTRGRYTCLVGNVIVTATKARQLDRKACIVGDLVRLDGDVSGAEGTLARITEVAERTTVLRRTADDDDPYERPIVANADQLVIVTALADPPPRPGMIDRILVAGYDAGLCPLLCLTKADLASPDELVAAYEPLGVPIVVTHKDLEPSDLLGHLRGHVNVLVGHSGVGKSTLVNALVPGLDRAVGDVNNVTGRGRHTSTTALAIPLPDDGSQNPGWVIDTPGVRSFGLSHVTPDTVIAAFDDLQTYTEECSRGCNHTAAAPECGLDFAAKRGELSVIRLASLRRVIDAMAAAKARQYD